MNKTSIVKEISAIFLLITFCLPLSKCAIKKVRMEQPQVSESKVEITNEAPQIIPTDPEKRIIYENIIPYKMIEKSNYFS